jgi:hypothetical protein
MIPEKEYLEAKKIVEEYEKQLKKKCSPSTIFTTFKIT